MKTVLEKDTEVALKLCYRFMDMYGDLLTDAVHYPRMTAEFILARNTAMGVLIRHEGETKDGGNKC